MKGKQTAQKALQWISPIKSVLGLLFLLAVQLPLRITRAANPYSIWTDELYSVLLAGRPLEHLVRITGVDAHPPGYYFLLKLWLTLTGFLGIDPGILLVRIPSILAWIAMVAIAWFAGRYLIGKRGGTLFAWLLAWNAQMAYIARDTRNYAFVTAALMICFFILLITDRLDKEGKHSLFKGTLLWTIYTLAAITALWMHLLAAFVMFFLGLTWIAISILRKPLMTNFLVGGFIAHTIAALSFVPWLIRLSNQLTYLQTVNVDWMTPATFTNWVSVFIFWYPAGRQFDSTLTHWFFESNLFYFLIPFTLVPIFIGLLSGCCRSRVDGDSRLAVYAGIGTVLPLLFVSTCWLITWFDIAKIFHAPRYPVLTVTFWLFACTCWVELALRRFHLSQRWGWLILLPLFLSSIFGEQTMRNTERHGFHQLVEQQQSNLPPQGTTAYYSPSVTTNYLAPTFEHFDLHPLSELAAQETIPQQLVIIKQHDWLHLQPAPDRLVGTLLSMSQQAEHTQWIKIPDQQWPVYSIFVLSNPKSDFIDRIKQGFGDYTDPRFEKAVSVALPEAQVYLDGFSHLELPENGNPFCWATREECDLRFDKPIPPGDYVLKIDLFRHPYPQETVEMTFSFQGEKRIYTQNVDPGAHTITIPVTLKKPVPFPTLTIQHSTWIPSDHIKGSQDHRELTFLFGGAWLEPDIQNK